MSSPAFATTKFLNAPPDGAVAGEARSCFRAAKNGNKYLAWAYVEAANFAVRYDPQIKRYYQRKRAKAKTVVATKAVAHKLARACYHMLRDGSTFDVNRAFA